jgi:predicted nucleotidyltransferase
MMKVIFSDEELLGLVSGDLISQSTFILLVGSLAEGLATTTSDIDIFVISREGFEGVLHSTQSSATAGNRKIEITIISTAEVSRMVLSSKRESYNGLSLRELEMMHKLFKGRVIHGQAAHAELIPNNLIEQFRVKVVQFYTDLAYDCYDDMLGSYRESDFTSAAMFARSLLDASVDRWLALAGDTYPKPKWRFKRAENILPESSYNSYVYAHFDGRCNDSASFTYHIESLLKLAQEFSFLSKRDEPKIIGKDSAEQLYISKPWSYLFYFAGNPCIRTPVTYYKLDSLSANIVECLYKCRSEISIVNCVRAELSSVDISKDVKNSLSRLESLGIIGKVQRGNA